MPSPTASPLPADATNPTGLLHTLLTMSLTGIALLQPLYAEDEATIRDFAWVRLNPAAQQLLGQPERPTKSLLALFPGTQANGVFTVCRQAFATGQPLHHQTTYQAAGLASDLLLVVQRYENLLAINFADATNRLPPTVEETLRQSQDRERAARAEAEAAQANLVNVFEQAPAMICIFEGPEHTFQFVNPPYQALVGERPLLGKPIAVAMPELEGQPIFGLLDHVYQTGETFHASEMLVQLDHDNATPAELEQRYYNFIYQARRNHQGSIDGILVFAYEVTPQVLARRQVQELNEELAAINEELTASNEEYLATNTALSEAQLQLRHLNQQLETRVQERTQQLAEQTSRLERLIQEAPAAICLLDGPALVFELLNARYQALFPDRVLLGRPVLQALPEVLDGPGAALLRQVYETGVTFEGRELLMHFARPSDGQLEARYFDFIYQARYDAASQINGLVVFGFEVTEQVLARQRVQELNEELAAINEEMQATNEELNETNARLTRTNADLDTFVYAASHDLKAPIANIEGLLNALRDYLPTHEQEPMVPRLLAMMEGAITRFQQTVGHLTNISRLQYASEQLPDEEVDLERVLEDVRLDLLPLLESAHAELQIAIMACPRVRFPEKNMRSVLFNLLSNAVKYRAPHRPPLVQVRTYCSATQVVLEVQDNGLGLSEAQQSSLFTMFRRLHSHVEGSGVGLYLIKRMIENAGGTIAVHSQPAVGSTFTVTLPRA